MPRWRMHSIAESAKPQADHYDGNRLVAPHFAINPDLMPVDVAYEHHGSREQYEEWKSIVREMHRQARLIYRLHRLRIHSETQAGLYLAGNFDDMRNVDRDRMMILVFELEGSDCSRWQEIDADARGLLKYLNELCERDMGVCLRYYVREVLATPSSRSERRSENIATAIEPLLSPLHDLYEQDHPSIRRMPRVRLPTIDTQRRTQAALPPTNTTDSRAELALQRISARSQADAELFRTDRNDSVDLPQGRIGRNSTARRRRREAERKEEESGSESETQEYLAYRYRHLTLRIDREHHYNLEAALSDYQIFTRMLNMTRDDRAADSRGDSDDWSNNSVAGGIEPHNMSDSSSDDDTDAYCQCYSDDEDDDEMLKVEDLPRIDARDLPAARNQAATYLRQLTRSGHERWLGGRSR